MIVESFSVEDTENFAYSLGQKSKPGDIYCLEGDLGAGKTAFARGFARGMEIEDYITSPTFTIVNEYEGKINLYHFDVYRVEDADGLYDTGYEEYFYGGGVCLVEWASLVSEAVPEEAVWIYIYKDSEKEDNYRRIEVTESMRG